MTIENFKIAEPLIKRLEYLNDAIDNMQDDSLDVTVTYQKSVTSSNTYGIVFKGDQFSDLRMYLLAAMNKEKMNIYTQLAKL